MTDNTHTPWDVIALGETLLRLTPPQQQLLSQTRELEVIVGGSESNTLAGLAGLGRRCSWLSRLPQHDLGALVVQKLREHGVDTRQVSWAAATERLGIFYTTPATPPLPGRVIYDRAASAASRMQPEDLPQSLFTAGQARLFHSTGITAALGTEMLATLQTAWQWAGAAGWRRSFDFNYRSNLWPIAQAWNTCQPLMDEADVVFLSLRDVQAVNRDNAALQSDQAHLDWLRDSVQAGVIVVTRGAEGATLLTADGQQFDQPSLTQLHHGRIGRGDSFSAGFLDVWLDQPDDYRRALRQAAVCAAVKSATPGDMAYFVSEQIQAVVNAEHDGAAELVR
ncbi:MAG: sugar kinase [Thiolinea sp.]